MSDLIKKEISNQTLLKCIKLSSKILSMHGSVAGDRVCQDWSGSEDFNPENMFTESELQDISYNYEIDNSRLDDYCPEYHGMHDEMVVSFAMSGVLKDAADTIEQLQQRVVELELQVKATALLQDETAAQNESLGQALHQALIHWSAMGVKDEDGLAYDECEKRLNQSPQTSLVEVRAKAVEELKSQCNIFRAFPTDKMIARDVILVEEIDHHIQQARNGKDGE